MNKTPSVAAVARELRLSAWLFGIFAVLSAAIAIVDFVVTRRVDGGWPVATVVALVACAGVVHFAQQLDKAQDHAAGERSNS